MRVVDCRSRLISAPGEHVPDLQFKLPENFYTRYWQREPLVIRSALADYVSPISPDELAGLACMEAVESRIVLERGGRTPWEVRHGPFDESAFRQLPDSHWTLLVQAVDHWEPRVAELRRQFPAIPNWRLDDVMVSYASDGGSVGPHVDQYDVFLLQGLGRRHWQIGSSPTDHGPVREDTELNLLQDFTAASTAVLEPGDALYLPPGFAHWGIAEGECVTLSIGFRSPAVDEMIDAFGAQVAESLPPDRRCDAPPVTGPDAPHPGEITPAVLDALLDAIRRELTPDAFAQWFGAFATAKKYPEPAHEFDESAAIEAIDAGGQCRPRTDSRYAFVDQGDTLHLFADGHGIPCPVAARTLIENLCDGRDIGREDVGRFRPIVLDLLRHGSLEID